MSTNSAFVYCTRTCRLFRVSFAKYWTRSFPMRASRCWATGGRRMDRPSCLSRYAFEPALLIEADNRGRTLISAVQGTGTSRASHGLLDFGTGLRRGELAGLKWQDIDFEKRQIAPCRSIVAQRIGPVNAEASSKPIPLDDCLVDDLMMWRRKTPYARDSDYVFASTKLKGKQQFG